MSKPVPPASKAAAGSRAPLMRLILDLLDERAAPMTAFMVGAALYPAVLSDGAVRKALLALVDTGEVARLKRGRAAELFSTTGFPEGD